MRLAGWGIGRGLGPPAVLTMQPAYRVQTGSQLCTRQARARLEARAVTPPAPAAALQIRHGRSWPCLAVGPPTALGTVACLWERGQAAERTRGAAEMAHDRQWETGPWAGCRVWSARRRYAAAATGRAVSAGGGRVCCAPWEGMPCAQAGRCSPETAQDGLRADGGWAVEDWGSAAGAGGVEGVM